MFTKHIAWSRKDVYNFTQESLKKYFLELDPLYIKDGPKVKKVRTFKAKSLTPYEEQTDYSPIVEIGKDKYISLHKVQGIIAS